MSSRVFATGVAVVAMLIAVLPGGASAKGHGGLQLSEVAKFDEPTFLTAPRGAGKIAYVTEREGRIKLLDGGHRGATFLDMRRWVGCCDVETGLLSVAFPDDYAKTRRFYVYFTNRDENIEVDEFRSSRRHPLHARAGTRRKVIEIHQSGDVNHNGGQLAFGPDGFLYLGTGDGGNFEEPSGDAQRKGSLLGKLLRIDPTGGKGGRPYAVPHSNPYVGRGGRNEIYARGLRNPYRFSFDRRRILIGDVGQDRREEVDVETLGSARRANFGWKSYEGTLRFEGNRLRHRDDPAFEYSHGDGSCAIVGGYVVRDPRLKRLEGRYVYGDYCSGKLRSLVPKRGRAHGDRSLGVGQLPGIVSFGEDARHRLYTIELGSGRISRLTPG